tara:strand:- start:2433 stop:2786 length:354 start_codon:yes stop_codon:yes gene_type:complete
MRLIAQNTDTVETQLGEYLATVTAGTIYKNIIVQIEQTAPFWGKRLLNKLAAGVIDQTYYNTIVNNQSNERQIIQIESTNVNKADLIDLVGDLEIDTGGDSASIITNLNNINIQLII